MHGIIYVQPSSIEIASGRREQKKHINSGFQKDRTHLEEQKPL